MEYGLLSLPVLVIVIGICKVVDIEPPVYSQRSCVLLVRLTETPSGSVPVVTVASPVNVPV